MPSVETFILMRCFQGIGIGGSIVTSFVLTIEYCGLNHRETITAIYHIPVSLGQISTAVVSYLIRNMSTYQLIISIPACLCIFIYCLILESPKWLMDNDHITKATKIMMKICKLLVLCIYFNII